MAYVKLDSILFIGDPGEIEYTNWEFSELPDFSLLIESSYEDKVNLTEYSTPLIKGNGEMYDGETEIYARAQLMVGGKLTKWSASYVCGSPYTPIEIKPITARIGASPSNLTDGTWSYYATESDGKLATNKLKELKGWAVPATARTEHPYTLNPDNADDRFYIDTVYLDLTYVSGNGTPPVVAISAMPEGQDSFIDILGGEINPSEYKGVINITKYKETIFKSVKINISTGTGYTINNMDMSISKVVKGDE